MSTNPSLLIETTVPLAPGYISEADAKRLTGYSNGQLRRICTEGTPFLDWRKVRTISTLAKRKAAPPLRGTQFNRADLEELIARRDSCHRHPKRLSIRESADYLGLSVETLRSWCCHGCPHLNGRKPDMSNGYVRYRGNVKKGSLLACSDLDTIKDKLSRLFQPYVDAQGTWLPLSLARRRHPRLSEWVLRTYANKPCPFLEGETLHARWAEVLVANYKETTALVFLAADLERMATPKKGPRPRLQGHQRIKSLPLGSANTSPVSEPRKPKRGRPSASKRHQEWLEEHEAGKTLTQLAKKYDKTRRTIVAGIRSARERRAREINSIAE